MANSWEYWNPKNETLPRDDLRALQFVKLKRLCEWAYARSAFHRRRWDAATFHPELSADGGLHRLLVGALA